MKAFAATALVAALIAVGSQAQASAGSVSSGALSLMPPALARDADGTRVEGAVCRLGPSPVAGLESVVVEQVGPDGAVLAQADARVPASLRARGAKCAYYHVQTAWTAEARVQVCMTPERGPRVCSAAR